MANPTTQPLTILIGGLDATKNVPVASIRIELERGNRVSTASFTVDDASGFGVGRWQTILMISPDYSTQIFLGYVTDYSLRKQGITTDYDVTCSSVEVRLQKSTVNGICSGTDASIIGCLFTNSLPDLTGLFDYSGISALRLDSFDFPALDTNLMEAFEDLASKVDANYSWTPSENTRVNHFPNPNMNTNGNYLTGELPTGSDALSNFPTWNSANVAWGAAFGDSSGGMQVTLQDIGGTDYGFLTAGNDTKHALKYTMTPGGSVRISCSVYGLRDGSSGSGERLDIRFEPVVYNEGGTFVKSLGKGTLGGTILTTWARSARDLRFLTDADNIPSSGYIDYIIYLEDVIATGATFVNIEKVLIEAIEATGGFFPAEYFDGEQKDVALTGETAWLGTARDSASYLGDGQTMNWSDTPPDAAYDVDIGTSDFINDLELEDMALDNINTVVVTGAYTYQQFDFEYPSNNQQTHFDLEESIYAMDGEQNPRVYINTGDDTTPVWDQQTVQARIGNIPGSGNDLTYDSETHWVEFATAPPDLKRGWRVEGRRKERIRAVVEDELQVESDGVQLVTAIYNESATTEEDVFEIGLAELARRAGTRRVTFTTLEPGLMPGQEIDIADSSQGIDETLIIERVSMQYAIEGEFGGSYVMSSIEAGDRNPDLADIVANNTRMATNRPPITADTADKALTQLRDDDNLPLWDDDNALLYQATDNS